MPRTSAQKILDTVWSDNEFPVDPAFIARELGLDVVETNIENDVSGALIKQKNQDPVIILNASDSKPRKRFTCAHELGHYVSNTEKLNQQDYIAYEHIDFRNGNSRNGTDSEEVFANQFAACLLMPESEVRKLFKHGMPIVLMSSYFGVSDDAIRFRLMNLNLL